MTVSELWLRRNVYRFYGKLYWPGTQDEQKHLIIVSHGMVSQQLIKTMKLCTDGQYVG